MVFIEVSDFDVETSWVKGLKHFCVKHEYVVPGKDSAGVYRSGHAQVPSLISLFLPSQRWVEVM